MKSGRSPRMGKSSPKKIVVSKDGPYKVSGGVPLSMQIITPNKEGFSWDWKKAKDFETQTEFSLCRCGHSKNKPFCDGTHAKIKFDGTETASREPYIKQAQLTEGPTLSLTDAEVLCAFARFCDPNGQVWNQVERTDDPKVSKMFVRQVNNCPSGRLVAWDRATGKAVEHALAVSIGIIEDPVEKVSGPLWLRGGIPLVAADGAAYEVRNRVTVCRCGASKNKPFCDGSHAAVKFRDSQ